MPKLRIVALAGLISFLGIGCATISERPSETPSEKYHRLTEEIRRNQADSFQQHEAQDSVSGEEFSGIAGGIDLNEGSPGPGDDVARRDSDRFLNGGVPPPSPGLSKAFRDHGATGQGLTPTEATSPQREARLREGPTDSISAPLLVLSTVPPVGHVGEEIVLNISVSGAEQLYSAPFYLFYNSSVLELTKVTQGEFLKQDGQQTAFFHANHPETGRVIIGLSRLGRVSGVNGSGPLVTLTFRAKNSGVVAFTVQDSEFRNAEMEIVPVQTLVTRVNIE